LYICSRTNPI